MAKKISLTELTKNGVAFLGASTITIDAALLFADRADILPIPGNWYVLAPLASVALVGLPVTLNLADRLVQQIVPRRGQIVGYRAGAGPGLRAIPMSVNGHRRSLLTSTVQTIFGDGLPTAEETRTLAPVTWRVPMDDVDVVIGESELDDFLTAAAKREKHQFSRRYWCEKRRPAMDRVRYEGIMRLLVEAGLVTGRHEQGGASGRLVTKPRHALAFLKNESAFAA